MRGRLTSRDVLLTIEDYRRLARRRLPRVVFDFIDGGAETELTQSENQRAFERVWFRPHVGAPAGLPDLTTELFGRELSMPVIIAPTGLGRIANPVGDLAGVRAAGQAGTAFALAMAAGYSLEEIAQARSGPIWFQIYDVGGREAVERTIERAARARYDALIVTFDTPVAGKRERDQRNGAMALLGPRTLGKLPYVPQLIMKPRWFFRRISDGLVPVTPNIEGGVRSHASGARGGPVGARSLCWTDLEWVRSAWSGPILVKGILTAEDARRAVDAGVNGVIVSNHGGRQLDGAVSSLSVLPEIAAAVGNRCEILLDSGIRRGSDVVKALSLGAKAVLIGRPWLYGLAAAGQEGIEGVLAILRADIDRTMQLMGRARLADLDRSAVRAPPEWFDFEECRFPRR